MKRKDDPLVAGALWIDKPAGMTSHDVVGKVRRALGIRRVGHAGTLDPMATGVLVIGVGPTTRLLGIVGGHDKEYEATIRLGSSTSTDDRTGEVLREADVAAVAGVSTPAITDAVGGFLGTIAQRPSSVSAVKIDGKRAYDRVRSGEDVDLPERTVTVSAFDVLEVRRFDDYIDIDVRVECSAGTYIRALARDLGDVLGIGGHLTQLRRTRSGGVSVDDCLDVAELEERGRSAVMTPATFARRELPVIDIDEEAVGRARHGSPLTVDASDTDVAALIGPGEDLVAAVSVTGGAVTYSAVFPPMVDPGAGESGAGR